MRYARGLPEVDALADLVADPLGDGVALGDPEPPEPLGEGAAGLLAAGTGVGVGEPHPAGLVDGTGLVKFACACSALATPPNCACKINSTVFPARSGAGSNTVSPRMYARNVCAANKPVAGPYLITAPCVGLLVVPLPTVTMVKPSASSADPVFAAVPEGALELSTFTDTSAGGRYAGTALTVVHGTGLAASPVPPVPPELNICPTAYPKPNTTTMPMRVSTTARPILREPLGGAGCSPGITGAAGAPPSSTFRGPWLLDGTGGSGTPCGGVPGSSMSAMAPTYPPAVARPRAMPRHRTPRPMLLNSGSPKHHDHNTHKSA